MQNTPNKQTIGGFITERNLYFLRRIFTYRNFIRHLEPFRFKKIIKLLSVLVTLRERKLVGKIENYEKPIWGKIAMPDYAM